MQNKSARPLFVPAVTVVLVTSLAPLLCGSPITGYAQTNLVSDIPGLAANTDPSLKNPWGVAFGATSPFWVSDNGAGLATLYNGSGTPQALQVTIPAPGGGASAPTGQVFNGTGAFGGDIFIFATENGTIAGWRGALGTTAETLFDNSAGGAVYKGLALASIGSNTYLYATDFHNNRIDVFPSAGAPTLAATFTDPNLPAGFAPFNIAKINGQLYVTFAKQAPGAHDDQPGPGNGFVSIFDLNGSFVKRFASGGDLNSPWGLTIAPPDWGSAAGDLLIGNFGDGKINAFDLAAGTLVGTVADLSGNPIVNDGLWSLTPGNGGNGGRRDSVYLTAGLNGEENGLFARIDAVPEPKTMILLGAGMALLAAYRKSRVFGPNRT